MKKVKLNKVENEVYNACILAATKEGDNGYEFTLEGVKIDMTMKTLRGYLGQLTLKGLIQKFEDSYFDFGVRALTSDWCKISGFEYDFEIVIEN